MQRLTSEDYLIKLIDKKIKVIPLSKYIDSHTKILHKCICGNEWEVSPISVLANNNCGCNRNKHNTYQDRLDKKEIKVLPLETYIDASTKILHKCICGNEWHISPNSILAGSTCKNCYINKRDFNTKQNYITNVEAKYELSIQENYISHSVSIEHKCLVCKKSTKISPRKVVNKWKCSCHLLKKREINYINKIKEYNIKLLDNFSPNLKMLHKCTCGKEWSTTMSSILHGYKCGCKRVYKSHGEAFYKDKATVLYYVQIEGLNSEKLYKIGITLYDGTITKSLKKRFYGEKYKIIQADKFIDGANAFILEQKIILNNKQYQYIGEKVLKSGNTELFIKDIR